MRSAVGLSLKARGNPLAPAVSRSRQVLLMEKRSAEGLTAHLMQELVELSKLTVTLFVKMENNQGLYIIYFLAKDSSQTMFLFYNKVIISNHCDFFHREAELLRSSLN
jgi:hypothetical protein